MGLTVGAQKFTIPVYSKHNGANFNYTTLQDCNSKLMALSLGYGIDLPQNIFGYAYSDQVTYVRCDFVLV